MVKNSTEEMSIVKKCESIGLNRSTYYYKAKAQSDFNLFLMRRIDELHIDFPTWGSRKLAERLNLEGHAVNRKRIQRLMKLMNITTQYQKPHLSKPATGHKIYPYLLRNLDINRANQVWCTDITYIRLRHGFVYLVAVMDWYSRKILSWRLSNTMDVHFCIEALEEALRKYGRCEIFNTDQGSQFTSQAFTSILKKHDSKISMDSKGRALDNIAIERFWRTIKYDEIYLKDYESIKDARENIGVFIEMYNTFRPHQSLKGLTPESVYSNSLLDKAA